MTTSFPFLAIAREYDVPYANVLAQADWFQNLTVGGDNPPAPFFQDYAWAVATYCACMDEENRRRPIAYLTNLVRRAPAPMSVDEIVNHTGRRFEDITRDLVDLEKRGMIRSCAGGGALLWCAA